MRRSIIAGVLLLVATAFPCGGAELKLPLLWTLETKTLTESAPTLVDLTGDGLCDVLVAAREEMIAVGHDGKPLWRWRTRARYMTYPSVLQRKGQSPLIYAADNGYGKGSALLTCLDGRGKVVWQADVPGEGSWAASPVVDLRHDGHYAVIQASQNGFGGPSAPGTSGIIAYDALTGKKLWQAAVDGFPVSPAVGDVDGDGKDEIAVATNSGSLALFDCAGAKRWQRLVSRPSETWATSAPIIFGASDGKARIVAGATEGRVTCVDASGTVLWAREMPGGVCSSLSVGDMDHDGRADIFAITQTGLIFRFDEDGLQTWKIDVQGRTLGAGALIDLMNDGHVEYVVSTQAGHLYVFNDAGQSIFEHIFDNRTTNMTPAFGDVTAASPGLEMVIAGGESGRIFCFGTPVAKDAPATALQWTSYRGNSRKTGSWFGLGQVGSAFMGLKDSTFGQLAAGDPVTFLLRVPPTKNLPLKATAMCVRPDGSRQSATTPIFGATGELPLPIEVVKPGSYRFTWQVVDSHGTKLASGQRAVFLDPFANDRAIVARALTALRTVADRVQPTLPLAASGLRRELATLELQARAAEHVQNAMSGGGGTAEQAAVDATVPVIKQARRALGLAAAVDAAKALGSATSLVAFETTLWESGGVDQAVPVQAANALKIARRVVPGEHDPVSLKLLNVTDRDLQVRIEITADKGGPTTVPMRSMAVPTHLGTMVWDAILDLDDSSIVTIPSMQTREVWLDTRFEDVAPGEHQVQVHCQALNGAETPTAPAGTRAAETLVNLNYRVMPFTMAASSAFRVCLWANYTVPGAVNDLMDHGNNVFCVGQNSPVYDAQGKLTGFDHDSLDKIMSQLKGHDVVALVQGEPALKPAKDSPEYTAQFKLWLADLKSYMASMGFDTAHFAMYPYDEPGGNGWESVNAYAAFGARVKAADPSIRMYLDGGAELPMVEKMLPVTDIWTAGLGQLAEESPEMKLVRSKIKDLWSYDCGYGYTCASRASLKDSNIVAEYRTAAMFAFRWNGSGIGFWAYNLGPDPWLPQPPVDYPIVYPGKSKPVSSRRWEAVRDGVEDYRILAALRQAAPSVKDAALKSRIEKLIAESLPELLDRSRLEVIAGLGRPVFAASMNDARLNTFRDEMLGCVEALGKAR